MKTKKRLSVLLACVMLFTLLPAFSAFAEETSENVRSGYCGAEGDGSNLSWTLDSDGTLTISGHGAMKDYDTGMETHPWRSAAVAHIVLEPGVTSIGKNAFDNLDAVDVFLPDGLTEIGFSSFSDCRSLARVELPESLVKIGDFAFVDTAVSSFHIPAAVEEIGRAALTSFALTSVSVAEQNPNYAADADGCLYTKDLTILLRYPVGCDKTSFSVPQTVRTIGDYAFAGAAKLQHVTLTQSIISIGSDAFSNCSSLKEIVFPDSLCFLGPYAFRNCTSLTEVTTPPNIRQMEYVFLNCTGLKTLTVSPALSVNDSAFFGCSSLERVNISDLAAWCKIVYGGNTVDSSHFSHPNPLYYAHDLYLNGEKLENVVIPDEISQINAYAFEGGSFETVTFPAGLSHIDDYAFAHCANLRDLRLPARLTGIGSRVFFECPSITEVVIPGSVRNWTGSRFEGVGAVFENCTGITSVTVREGVPSLPMAMFHGCTSLETVVLPESVKALGILGEDFFIPPFNYENGVFEGCTALRKIRLPQQLELLGANSFFGCTGLTEVTVPGSVKQIGKFVFSNCASLEKAMLEQGVPCTGWGMFVGSGLKDLYLPKSLSRIKDCLVSGTSYRYGVGPSLQSGDLTIHFGGDEDAWDNMQIENTPEGCGNDIIVDSPVQCNYHEDTVRREITLPPTCTAAGAYDDVFCCRYCEQEYARTSASIPATGHAWGEWEVVKQASEEEEGLLRRVCENDPGHEETEIIPRLAYDDDGNVISQIRDFIERIFGWFRGIIDWFLRLFRRR